MRSFWCLVKSILSPGLGAIFKFCCNLRLHFTYCILTFLNLYYVLTFQQLSKNFIRFQEDNRLIPLLRHIGRDTYLGPDYKGSTDGTDAIRPEMLDQVLFGYFLFSNLKNFSFQLSRESYPLCMQNLHSELRQKHHLRHGGRMQYGLFLKGIGLSLEDSMRFWRSEFTKVMDDDRFEKGYAYNVRHSYGKEGGHKNYSALSCSKVINTNPPGPADAHGCPFRHWDANVLEQKLRTLKLASNEVHKVKTRSACRISCGISNITCFLDYGTCEREELQWSLYSFSGVHSSMPRGNFEHCLTSKRLLRGKSPAA